MSGTHYGSYRLVIPAGIEGNAGELAAFVDEECGAEGLVRITDRIRTDAVSSPNETVVFAQFDAREAARG